MTTPQLICDDCVTNDAGEQFSLWLGLNEDHQQAVLDAAISDPMIINNTGDAKRFSTMEKLEQWLAGNRLFYILTPKNNPNKLAGLVWFSQENLETEMADKVSGNTDWTFAIRVYQDFRGQRLSSPFMKEAFKAFWQQQPEQPIWLSTQADNDIARKIYEKYGFELIGELNKRAYYIIHPVQ